MKPLSKLWLQLRVNWSNCRHAKDIKDCEIKQEINTLGNLVQAAKDFYKKFKYTYDGPTELFDSMHTPAYCYSKLLNGVLLDDCDGFHAGLYHLATKSGFDCSLLTYIADDWKKSHTVLLIDTLKYYYIFDYDRYQAYVKFNNSIDDVVKMTAEKNKSLALCYNLVKFENNKYIVTKTSAGNFKHKT